MAKEKHKLDYIKGGAKLLLKEIIKENQNIMNC